MSKPITISVLGDVRDLTSKLDAGESRLSRFGGAAGKAGAVVAGGLAVAGAAAVAFGIKAVGAASNAQQSVGATETVYGKYADTVIAKSGEAAQAVGLSANAYRENSNLLGALLKNQGVAVKDLAGETDNLIGMSADLAATYGGTTTTAVEAMSAAYKGEFNQLEKYGISLKASTIQAELAARGQDKLTGSALDAAKQQATTDLITRQAGDALGAFGRESGTLANQQQKLGAQMEDLSAKAGAVLLPVLTTLAAFANTTLLPGLESLGAPIMAFAQVVGAQAAPVLAQLGDVFTTTILPAVTTLGTALAANLLPYLLNIGAFVTGSVLPALASLGGFLAANVLPVLASLGGFVVGTLLPALGAFGGFITGTVLPAVLGLAQRVGTNLAPVVTTLGQVITTRVVPAVTMIVGKFREWSPTLITIATGVGNVIGFVITLASAILGKVLPVVIRFAGFLIGNVIPVLVGVVGAIISVVGAVVRFGGALVDGIKDAARFATGVGDKIGEAITVVSGIPGKAAAALAGLASSLFASGAELIQGLINGIESKIQAVRDKMSALGDTIKGFLPGSPVKTGPLTSWNNGGAGSRLVDTLITGLDNRRSALRSSMARIAGDLAGGLPGAPLLALTAGTTARTRGRFSTAATARAAGAQAITVTLTADEVHELERGRRLALQLRPYLAAGGTL